MKPRALFAGLATLDLTYVVDDYPPANGKTAATAQTLTMGGPAANAAATFAALGGEARLISAVGRHPLAAVIAAECAALGVELIDVAPDFAGAPVVASIFVEPASGRRTIVSAASNVHKLEQVDVAAAAFDGIDVALCDGHHAPLCREVARRAGVPLVLDCGSRRPVFDELLPLAAVAIASAGYAAALEELPGAAVAITRGHLPLLFRHGGGVGELAVPQVKAVDTSGAGDIFHGAFCCAWSSGATFVESLRFAAAVASESCRYAGTREWMRATIPSFERRAGAVPGPPACP